MRTRQQNRTAEVLFNPFDVHYGLPARIHTDQGAKFEKDMIKELFALTGIIESRTSIYHPISNGMTELLNRNVSTMIDTMRQEKELDWKLYIASLLHVYNCTRHGLLLIVLIYVW